MTAINLTALLNPRSETFTLDGGLKINIRTTFTVAKYRIRRATYHQRKAKKQRLERERGL